MIKSSSFKYLPYIGPDKFIFICAFNHDLKLADKLADLLVKDDYLLFYDCIDSDNEADPEEVATGILNCEKAIFILSEQSCDNLNFRNCINYALKEKKDVTIIKDSSFAPTHGLDMQLANVRNIEKDNVENIIKNLKELNVLNNELKGEGLRIKKTDNKKKKIVLIVSTLLIVFALLSAIFIKKRIDYLNSAEYVLKDVDGSEYVDITMLDESALTYLKDKTIGTLYMDGMDLKDISAISDINVTEIIISHNPHVSTLRYICDCKGIKEVCISMDMYKYAKDLVENGIRVRIVE